MAEKLAAPFIPVQYTGEVTTTGAAKEAADEVMAIQCFNEAVTRLSDVNRWAEWCKNLSFGFELTDLTGNPVTGIAETGMYIRIGMLGPKAVAGDGFDWVVIEQKEYIALNKQQEIFFIRVRPCEHPEQKSAGIAHFLCKEATNSFVITRDHHKVSATVYGRNEMPNTKAAGLPDKVRNAVIGAVSIMGASKLQWESLVEGILI